MTLKKLLALLVLPVVALFVVAGCASPSSSNNDRDDDDRDSSKSDDDEEESDDEDDAPEAPAEGELADPGTRVEEGTWLTHSFTSTDDGEALISARLVSVEPVTADQLAFLNEQFGDKIAGYDVWMIMVEEKKESGDTVEYDSDNNYFDVVDSDGERVQPITLIGWDECETNYFTTEFDTAGAVISQCFLGAAEKGDPEPAGVAYTGGYEDDNPYDYYDGKPLLFIKG